MKHLQALGSICMRKRSTPKSSILLSAKEELEVKAEEAGVIAATDLSMKKELLFIYIPM